ncbi:TPA: hypothetical protein PMC50_002504 [Vibrio cholerae]|nr:hypothetical protein [Vibrio cholerae]
MNIAAAFLNFGKKLALSLLTEKFISFISFKTARAIVDKTKTKLDDEILDEVEKAYKGQ